MGNDRVLDGGEVWISYNNDDGQIVQGYFELIEQNANFVKIKSNSNVLTIPYWRILKIKARLK